MLALHLSFPLLFFLILAEKQPGNTGKNTRRSYDVTPLSSINSPCLNLWRSMTKLFGFNNSHPTCFF